MFAPPGSDVFVCDPAGVPTGVPVGAAIVGEEYAC